MHNPVTVTILVASTLEHLGKNGSFSEKTNILALRDYWEHNHGVLTCALTNHYGRCVDIHHFGFLRWSPMHGALDTYALQ
jgi:hypothetical protein